MIKYFLFALAVLASGLAQGAGQDELQRSHLDGNLPPAEVFDRYLSRDIVAYFKKANPAVTRAEWRALREGPTQVGVAYPKFYLWTKVYAGKQLTYEGAMRVAAVGKTHFMVMHYLSKSSIRRDARDVATVFPAPLVPDVLRLAGRAPHQGKTAK